MQPHVTLNAPSAQDEIRLIPLSQGKFAIVDATDFEWLSQWQWYCRHGYAVRNVRRADGTRYGISMHREILSAPDGMDVDHMNLDRLDNRRANLRLATRSQNMKNCALRTNNSSGYKGVSFHKPTGKWQAYINCNGARIYLGYFVLSEDAARSYDEAARELHGEFARLNFPTSTTKGRKAQ